MAALTHTEEEAVGRKSCVELCTEALLKAVVSDCALSRVSATCPRLWSGRPVGARVEQEQAARMKESRVTEAEEFEQIRDDDGAGKCETSAKRVKKR